MCLGPTCFTIVVTKLHLVPRLGIYELFLVLCIFILYLDTKVTELVIDKHTYDSVPRKEVKILNLSLCQITTIEMWGATQHLTS